VVNSGLAPGGAAASVSRRPPSVVSTPPAVTRICTSAPSGPANNDKFLDLVARTAADQHATVEITDLADATQEVREALQRATQAAEALALPESR
jgi:hypothetical protein